MTKTQQEQQQWVCVFAVWDYLCVLLLDVFVV